MVEAAAAAFVYPTGRRVGPVALSVGPGVHQLGGANGAGKTTVLRMICGELQPTTGTIRVEGRAPATDPEARRKVAFLPAAPELPDFLRAGEAWRILAGLRRGPEVDGDERLRALGLDPRAPLRTLSAGQRKKAELVAALAGEPTVLLLDELFAPLDGDSAAQIAGWLDGWRRERVILLVAHAPPPLTVDSHLNIYS